MTEKEILGFTLDQVEMYLLARKRLLYEENYPLLRLGYVVQSFMSGKGYMPDFEEFVPDWMNPFSNVNSGPYSRELVRDFLKAQRLGWVRNAALDWFDVNKLNRSGMRELWREVYGG